VGHFLRKTSLDELPQLVNVFLGNMSLVGPRPALEYELQYYDEQHYERFAVKPGMTGLWQVSGRNELGFTEMLDLDADYASASNVVTDIKILVKTPMAAISKAA
jgi:lipopolysaccharide/colanic/teichoic acid biosynthesis glycosyltransferase